MAARRKPKNELDALEPISSPGEARDRLSMMARIAHKAGAWKPAPEVLTEVKAVPTRFIQIDRATRVRGWPIERFAVVHGPSNHGKTELCHGIGLSFLDRGHFYAFIDAEYTTPEAWLKKLMGDSARHPGFVALRPRSFEQTVDAVREFAERIANARERGELEPGTSCLFVVDSIKKLVPKRLLDVIEKLGAEGSRGNQKGSVDGMGGRAAQYKAALYAQWLDELVPLLYHTGTSMIAIARESEDPNADQQAIAFDSAWKIGGGKAIIYDSSLVARVTRDSWVRVGASKEDKGIVVGERKRVRIWKTKIGGKEDRHEDAYFHTSNGVETAPGFDTARDLLEQAITCGVIEQSSSWLSFDNVKWQGSEKAIAALRVNPELMELIDTRTRQVFEGSQEGAEVNHGDEEEQHDESTEEAEQDSDAT